MKRLYEFACNECGLHFERRVSDTRQMEFCPRCGGDAHKMLTAPAIHYHGDGFTGAAKSGRAA